MDPSNTIIQQAVESTEDELVPDDVPKDFEPGASAESMLVATGSIEVNVACVSAVFRKHKRIFQDWIISKPN